MTKDNATKMFKWLFDETLKASLKYNDLKKLFDKRVEERYGFHYSDFDMDEIIDAIDYGQGGMTFDKFDELMVSKLEEQSRIL